VKRSDVNGRILVACVVAVAAVAAGTDSALATEAAGQVYVKKGTWTETMLAARAAVLRYVKDEARRPAMATLACP